MTALRGAARLLTGLLLVAACAYALPRQWCGRGADALYRGEAAAQDDLARSVAASASDEHTASIRTGDGRFDGEWALVTQQMALLGLGQVVLAHPNRLPAYLPVMERCARQVVSPELTAFASAAWREQGLLRLDGDNGHAYLGYSNLALGMLRLVKPDAAIASLHDRLTEALARRLAAAPYGLIETYPGEAYPADVAMVAASIALHDQAVLRAGAGSAGPTAPAGRSGRPAVDHQAVLRRYVQAVRRYAVDPASGLLFQRSDARSGEARDQARASGTALASYALGFVDRDLSRELFLAVRRQQAELLGFGGVREYSVAESGSLQTATLLNQRRGDIDSGPLLWGVSPAATGFALAGARLHQDAALFTALYRTAALFGVPVGDDRGVRFLSGGPLGNAILLAMMTAGPGAPAEVRP